MNKIDSSSLFGNRRSHCFVSVTIALCLLLSALATLVATAPSVEAAQEWHQYRIGVKESPDTFNPFDMMAGTSWSVAHMMYEFLYAVGPMMEPVPQLAASHEVSNENKTWTYHLVENSYWHDGLPVTAHDVKFTFDMILQNPKETALMSTYVEGFDEVLALDDHTVQINLLEPKANMLSLIVPILPEHLWSKVWDDGLINRVEMLNNPEYFPDGPVGSGPFILKEYSMADSFIRLEAQKPYHRLPGIDVDSVNIDELLFIIYKSDNALVTALETDEIDVVDGIPPTVWFTVLENEDIEGQAVATLILEEFGFNCASEEWRTSVNETTGDENFPGHSTNYETTNLSVRQACAMATDIPYITETYHQGMAEEAYAIIPTATPFWHYAVPEEDKWHNYGIEGANALLDQYYSRDDDGDGIRENNTSGAELEFEFYYIRSNVVDEQTAHKMAEWWLDIGVQANLNAVSEGNLYNLEFQMAYDMFIWSWWPDVDPTWFLSVLTTDEIPVDESDTGAWSDSFYMNPVYDQLWEDQQHAMDPYERQAIVHEMQEIVYRDCPYISLVYPAGLIGYRTDEYENFPDMEKLTGISPSSFWYYFWITPITEGDENTAPYDVDIDGDDREVYAGTKATFSGSAKDLESSDEELTWTWIITGLGDTRTLYGRTISNVPFDDIGDFLVTLSVKDPEGLSGNMDQITVTVVEAPEDAGWINGYVNSSAGEPIEGALLVVPDTSFQQSSDEKGFYNLTLEPGTYQISAIEEGYLNKSASVTVASGNTSWQNFTMGMTAGSVAGEVYLANTSIAIEGALVELYRPGDEEATYAKKTDDDGSFEITLVDEGTYEVVVSKTGYETNDTKTVTVTSNETASLIVYLTAVEEEEDDGGGLDSVVVAVAILAIIAAIAAAVLLLKRRKGPESEIMEDEPLVDQPPET